METPTTVVNSFLSFPSRGISGTMVPPEGSALMGRPRKLFYYRGRSYLRIYFPRRGEAEQEIVQKWVFPGRLDTLASPEVHASFLVPQIILPGVVPFSFSLGRERKGAQGASSSHLESNRGPLSKKLISLNIILGASGSRRALTDSPQTISAPQTRETVSPLDPRPLPPLSRPRPLEP